MARIVVTYSDSDCSILIKASGSLQTAHVALPNGIVQSGQIVDPPKFGTLIKEAVKPYLPHTRQVIEAIIGLPEEHAFVKVVEVPTSIKKSEVANAIAFQWHSILPIAIEKVYYDYKPLRKLKQKQLNANYLVVAYPKTIIDSLVIALDSSAIIPVNFIPFSFGFAQLFNFKNGIAALIVHAQDEKNLAVAVVQNGATRFSSTIHATIGSPTCLKQIENIRKFYEQTIVTDIDKIATIIVSRGPHAQLLARQCQSFNLPIHITEPHPLLSASVKRAPIVPETNQIPFKITKSGDVIKIQGGRNRSSDLDYFTPLVGLLQSTTPFSILPPYVTEKRRLISQDRLVKTHFALTLLVFVVGIYVLFLSQMRFKHSAQLKSKVPSDQANKIVQEENDLAQRVTVINADLNSTAAYLSKQSHVTDSISKLDSIVDSTPGIAITNVQYSTSKKSLVIDGSRQNRAALTKFLDSLKAVQEFSSASSPLANLQSDGVANFSISITLAGGA